MNHTFIDCDINVARIDIRVREQRDLYLCRNMSIGRAFGLSPGRQRGTRAHTVCGHQGDHSR